MQRVFKGRPVLPAEIQGEAVVTRSGFNTLACFYKSILTDAAKAVCGDQDNPELFGRNLTGKVLCLPKSIGSTSAGAAWDRIAKMGIAPRALLFAQHIDSLSAAGLVLADVMEIDPGPCRHKGQAHQKSVTQKHRPLFPSCDQDDKSAHRNQAGP